MNAANDLQSPLPIAWIKTRLLMQRLLSEEHGQDLIEYALVFTFVGLGVIAAMKSVSTSIATVFASVGTTITNAT